MRLGTIFSANDKSLYDALNQKTVTNPDLRSLFLTRGILVSSESSRKHLAKHFARLFHDYQDYQALAKLFGGTIQREKISTVRIDTTATITDFQSAAFELKAELEEAGALVRVNTSAGTRLDIELRYTKVNFNKSEFRQVNVKNARISLFFDNGELVVHAPNNDEVQEWLDSLARIVREKTEAEVKFNEIRLPPTMDAKAKTAFFTQLIKNVENFTLKDVSDIFVAKAKDWADEGDDDEVGITEIRIDKASLRGRGVLESAELKLLEKRGFYVSRIIWTATPNVPQPDIYEFEAQFARADECADFAYLPRGFYKFLAEGSYNVSRTSFSTEEEVKYGKLIESAARSTFAKLPGHGYEQA